MLFDFAAIAPDDRYKLLVSTVVPRPIAWVTSLSAAGRLNAAPFSFFNALCSEPPIIAVGVGGRHAGRVEGEGKDTAANIRATGQFVVNLVSHAQREAMNVTAIEFPAEVNELAEAGLTAAASAKVRPPRIAESPVALECELFVMLDVSVDHAIILGRVLAVHIADAAVLDAACCYIDTPALDLIARMHGRGWYCRTTDRFEMPRLKRPQGGRDS